MTEATDLLDALSRAFATQDLQAALGCFAKDDDVVYSGSEIGEVAAGREELRALLTKLFEREDAYSWDITKVWSVPREAFEFVIAEAVGHSRGSGEEEDFAYRLVGVLTLEDEGWRLLQLHGVEPLPA